MNLPRWCWALPKTRQLDFVQLTSPKARPRTARGYTVAHAAIPKDDSVDVEGLPVTSGARTVLDLSRARPLGEALVVADAALRLQLRSPE